MGIWRIVELVLGVFSILFGIFSKEFKPMGWTSWLIWGTGENARIPRWIAGLFYVVLGLLLFFIGLTGK